MKDLNTKTGIIRFEVDGLDGLKPMDLSPYEFAERPEQQLLHVYFEDEELGLGVGVWETTPMREPFGPYPGDEFIYVLKGNFTMLDNDGTDLSSGVECKAGQSVIFRNGVPVSWKQHDILRKFYMTYTDPRAETPTGLSAEGGIQALDSDMTLTDADLLEGTSIPQRERVFFTNDHGNFEVGLWDTQAFYENDANAFPWHEFGQVLEGECIITEEDGTKHIFKTGDVFFIPAGTVCKWHVPRYLRKFYAALDPNIRPQETQ
ncbi:MAG: cupin domain-containing protein [Arenibacterium sp.]